MSPEHLIRRCVGLQLRRCHRLSGRDHHTHGRTARVPRLDHQSDNNRHFGVHDRDANRAHDLEEEREKSGVGSEQLGNIGRSFLARRKVQSADVRSIMFDMLCLCCKKIIMCSLIVALFLLLVNENFVKNLELSTEHDADN